MRQALLAISARIALAFIVVIAAIEGSAAHDEWSNGMPIPAWVKSSCCGPEDVHHLTAGQVRAMADGWHVEGYKQVVAYGRELPSQDGDYWIFYKNFPDGSQTPVYCFFAPAQGY